MSYKCICGNGASIGHIHGCQDASGCRQCCKGKGGMDEESSGKTVRSQDSSKTRGDWFDTKDDIFSDTTSQPYIVGVPSSGVIGGLPGIGFNGEMYSMDGYKRHSKDVNRPYNVIPSRRITMKDVDFPVLGIDNKGNSKMMKPGRDYTFPGNRVLEIPFKKKLWF